MDSKGLVSNIVYTKESKDLTNGAWGEDAGKGMKRVERENEKTDV